MKPFARARHLVARRMGSSVCLPLCHFRSRCACATPTATCIRSGGLLPLVLAIWSVWTFALAFVGWLLVALPVALLVRPTLALLRALAG